MARTNGDGRTATKKVGAAARQAAREISKENTPKSPVVINLQQQVANGLILYLNYKHYHWQVYGPLFRDLHLMFDEFAEAVLASVDEFAERIRMIGQDPVFSPTEAARTATVSVSEAGLTMREMIAEADLNAQIVIREMREAAKIADEHDDPGTVDLFSKVVQIHEKHEWYLRDILERGGLVSR